MLLTRGLKAFSSPLSFTLTAIGSRRKFQLLCTEQVVTSGLLTFDTVLADFLQELQFRSGAEGAATGRDFEQVDVLKRHGNKAICDKGAMACLPPRYLVIDP